MSAVPGSRPVPTVRDRVTEGLAAAARIDRTRLLAAAEAVLSAHDGVEVVEAPEPRTVMGRFTSARGTQCLSEVVVTTTRVRLGTATTWAAVLGWDEDGALAAALVLAADPRTAADLAEYALRLEADQREARDMAVAATRMEMA